jgi:multiple sugar transport system ATP-binding protein
MTLADRLVVLDRGRIQQIDTPQTVYAYPQNQMVATFIGTPPMNIIPAIYQDGQWHIGEQTLTCDPTLTSQHPIHHGQGYNLGIRAEHLTIAPNSPPESLLVQIQLIEPLGREILLRGQICGTQIQLNFFAPPHWLGSRGDRVSVQCDRSQLCVFDPSTGSTIFPTLR